MIRRSFLALTAAIPFVRVEGNETTAIPSLPTSVPGYPEIKVTHFHFSKGEIPAVEYFRKARPQDSYPSNRVDHWERITIPTFVIDSEGRPRSQKHKEEAAPLSSPKVQKAIRDEMAYILSECKNSDYSERSTMILVTGDHPDNKKGVGIALMSAEQIFKYGDRPE